MNKCKRCRTQYRYEGEYCSIKCRDKKIGQHPTYESIEGKKERKMWQDYWRYKRQGIIIKKVDNLFKTERFSAKYHYTYETNS